MTKGQQSADSPHEVRPRSVLADDVQRFHERVSAGQTAAVHRPVNPTILTPEEFTASSGFLDHVRSGPAVAVVGKLPWR